MVENSILFYLVGTLQILSIFILIHSFASPPFPILMVLSSFVASFVVMGGVVVVCLFNSAGG